MILLNARYHNIVDNHLHSAEQNTDWQPKILHPIKLLFYNNSWKCLMNMKAIQQKEKSFSYRN